MEDKRKHVRLASKVMGDDVSFSRYVKTKHSRTHGKPHSPKLPGLENASIRDGRSLFHRKGVKRADQMTNLLVSGHSNVKIGRDVRQGKLLGYRIFTLSLEERATCPRSCVHWQSCYGNNMPYAKRIDHTDPEFLPRLAAEIAALCAKHKGVLLRLHALGDFYSVDYVMFWKAQLRLHDNLVIFGYTAHPPHLMIGNAISSLIDLFSGRAMMRFSNGGLRSRSTVPIANAEDCPPGAFVCPEQTGQFDACGKCGACWSTLKNVAFVDH